MTTTWLDKYTESVRDPGWVDMGFSDPDAQRMWSECPAELRQVVCDEAAAGNYPWNILKNHDLGIVLVALSGPPRTPQPTVSFIVHTSFELGNYCYDGTVCTYQHTDSGCFISFEEPEFQGPPMYGSGA